MSTDNKPDNHLIAIAGSASYAGWVAFWKERRAKYQTGSMPEPKAMEYGFSEEAFNAMPEAERYQYCLNILNDNSNPT